MNTLIIGGTSGLGLEIARNESESAEVIITGRHDPEVDFADYREFDLTGGELPRRIGYFIANLPPINTLIYAAGFYQEGRITDLSDEAVDDMIDVCGRGLVFAAKKLLQKQDSLGELVAVTSTSQWTPRELEPVYNFTKAGAAHVSNGLSLDPRVGKTLVVGPSGMATEFWDEDGRDTSHMMQPDWVAEQIQELRSDEYGYKFARVLGNPNRVEIVETRA